MCDTRDFEIGDWVKGRSVELSGQFGKVEDIIGLNNRSIKYVFRMLDG